MIQKFFTTSSQSDGNKMTSVILRLLTIVHSVYSVHACTGYPAAFCLKAPSLEDTNEWVSTQYIKQSGTMWGCKMFISPITGGSGITYSDNYWQISLPTSPKIHCYKKHLDECGASDWVYSYSGRSWPNLANLYIEPCDYINECSNSINGTFCITNSGIFQGEYQYVGCNMERPYYTHPHFIISWNAIFLLWIVSHRYGSFFPVGNAAYCDRNELEDCNGNWYIWDEIQLKYIFNQNVTSGSCDNVKCEGTDYDICVVRGVSENHMISILWSDVIGRYANSNSCYQWNTNLMNEAYSIQYYPYDDAYYLVFDNNNYLYTHHQPRCIDSNITRCYTSGNQWQVFYEQDGHSYYQNGTYYYYDEDIYEYRNAAELIVTDCSDIDNECDIDYDLFLNVFDTAVDHLDFAGKFRFNTCDENGYPVFYQNEDINGAQSNYSVISFDIENRAFEIHRKYDEYIYASCHSLSLDYCDGFWYSNSTNFTLTQIPTTTPIPTTSIPTTSIPTTSIPTTSIPNTSIPTTFSVTTTQLTTTITTSDSAPINPMQNASVTDNIKTTDSDSGILHEMDSDNNNKNIYIIPIVVCVSILSCLLCLFGMGLLIIKFYKRKHMETIISEISPSKDIVDTTRRRVQGSVDEIAMGNNCKEEDCSTETDDDDNDDMYVVYEVPAKTSGEQVDGIDNEMAEGVKVGATDRMKWINGMCTDCKQMKKGKVCDENDLFYCFECYKYYDEYEDMYDDDMVDRDHETTTGGL